MIRRFLCLALAVGLLLCLTAAPEQAQAETYVPLPELLLFRQANVQKDLGAQRKECRTYTGWRMRRLIICRRPGERL